MSILVDARRLLCPMPIIRLQDAVAQCPVGEIVEIVCTDPGVKNDIPAWCKINGQSVIESTEQDHEITFKVRKQTDG